MKNFKNVDEYINSFPIKIQEKLTNIRKLLQDVVLKSDEAINHGMPTFKLNGKNLVHFAAFKNHIGFYPTPSLIEKFKNKLKNYKYSKGTIQFPLSENLPPNLIKEIVVERINKLESEK